eukprot:m.96468 g.96468  ORF g.96468 m.96468 type:complete len:66 (+) comp21986_c2_seq5:1273-1470(+)
MAFWAPEASWAIFLQRILTSSETFLKLWKAVGNKTEYVCMNMQELAGHFTEKACGATFPMHNFPV